MVAKKLQAKAAGRCTCSAARLAAYVVDRRAAQRSAAQLATLCSSFFVLCSDGCAVRLQGRRRSACPRAGSLPRLPGWESPAAWSGGAAAAVGRKEPRRPLAGLPTARATNQGCCAAGRRCSVGGFTTRRGRSTARRTGCTTSTLPRAATTSRGTRARGGGSCATVRSCRQRCGSGAGRG
jgi:hypothetical protein